MTIHIGVVVARPYSEKRIHGHKHVERITPDNESIEIPTHFRFLAH